MAVGQHLLGLDAAPGLHGVAAVRRDLEEVGAVVLVEAQRGLGQAGRRAVHGREVAPDGVGHAVDGLRG